MKNSLFLLPIFLFQSAIFFLYRQHIPIFDGGIYYRCFQNAVFSPFQFHNYGCGGHSSYFYFIFLKLFTFSDSIVAFNALNAFLFMFSTWIFFKICQKIFGDEFLAESVLASAIYGTLPSILGNLFHFNLDNGILIFSIFLAWNILKERWILSSIIGLILVYTKETGVFPYFFLLATFLIIFRKNLKHPLRWYHLSLVLPLILFILHNLYLKHLFILDADIWVQTSDELLTPKKLFKLFTYFNFIKSAQLRSALYLIFILNFQWLLTLPILITMLFFSLLKKNHRIIPLKNAILILLWLITSVYSVTRYLSVANVRYFMLAIPFLILTSLVGLIFLTKRRTLRLSYLSLCLSFSLLANFTSVDPITRALYETLPYGQSKLYYITSVTGEGKNFIRDQMVYNLQFLNNHPALEELFRLLKEKEKLPLFVPHFSDFYYFWYRHPQTLERTHHFTYHQYDLPIQDIGGLDTIMHRELPHKFYYFFIQNLDLGIKDLLCQRFPHFQKWDILGNDGPFQLYLFTNSL